SVSRRVAIDTREQRGWFLLNSCRRKNAKAQTWKEQPGGFGSRARLHGNDVCLWSTCGQERDDQASSRGCGKRRHILGYRRRRWSFQQLRTCRRGTSSL